MNSMVFLATKQSNRIELWITNICPLNMSCQETNFASLEAEMKWNKFFIRTYLILIQEAQNKYSMSRK